MLINFVASLRTSTRFIFLRNYNQQSGVLKSPDPSSKAYLYHIFSFNSTRILYANAAELKGANLQYLTNWLRVEYLHFIVALNTSALRCNEAKTKLYLQEEKTRYFSKLICTIEKFSFNAVKSILETSKKLWKGTALEMHDVHTECWQQGRIVADETTNLTSRILSTFQVFSQRQACRLMYNLMISRHQEEFERGKHWNCTMFTKCREEGLLLRWVQFEELFHIKPCVEFLRGC